MPNLSKLGTLKLKISPVQLDGLQGLSSHTDVNNDSYPNKTYTFKECTICRYFLNIKL